MAKLGPCAECRFYLPSGGGGGYGAMGGGGGECHRNPPQVVNGEQADSPEGWHWPVVLPEDTCGEFAK